MNNRINLLFLGGAKRVSMARHFKRAAEALGCECAIFSYEMSTAEAIACEGEVIVGKRWRDPDVLDHLRQICRDKQIHAIIPFVDGAVPVAAQLHEVAFVPTGRREDAERMFDKVDSARLFEQLGLPIPHTYHEGEPCMCLIAKPRRGSASKGIMEISSLDALQKVLTHADDYLIQQRIDRREEYTVDCYVDTRGSRILATCPRRRIEVAGGEVTRTETVGDPEILDLARLTLEATGLVGAVTVQMMRDLDTNRLMLMEINPRLGGGAVCSVAAGADIPSLILREVLDLPPVQQHWQAGVQIARYLDEVVFYPNQND